MEYNERPVPPFQHKKDAGRKKWVLIGAIAGVLLIGGGIVWFVLRKPEPKPATVVVTSEQQQESASSTEPSNFKSATLGLEITYADGWKAKENSDKTEMIVTSPKTTYQRVDGTSTEGVFTIKLRHGVLPDGMPPTVQKAVAVRDSEVIAYDHPTPEQRQYTNVSYAGNDAHTFNFLMVSGNTTLKAGQPFGNSIDLVGSVYLIAGGFGVDEHDALTFDPVALSAMDTATFAQAMAIVKSVKIY
jgi:hypothetical protein